MNANPSMRLIRRKPETRKTRRLPTDEIVNRYLDSVAQYAVKEEDRIPLLRKILRWIEKGKRLWKR